MPVICFLVGCGEHTYADSGAHVLHSYKLVLHVQQLQRC